MLTILGGWPSLARVDPKSDERVTGTRASVGREARTQAQADRPLEGRGDPTAGQRGGNVGRYWPEQ